MVTNVTNTALSGLRASETRIQVAADNIANSTTPDFRASRVTQRSQDNGGVIVDISRTDAAPNLDEQLVQTNIAATEFQANLRVIQVQKNLDQRLFDIQA